MVIRRVLLMIFSITLMICAISLNVHAEGNGQIEFDEEYKEMLDGLPDEIAELLPEKLFSGEMNDIVEGAKELSSFDYIVNAVLEYLGFALKDAVKLLASLLGILILAAIMNTVKTSFSSSAVSDTFSMTASCAVFLTAVVAQYNIIRSVSVFFSRLLGLVNTMIPLLGVLYAMGGNVAGAVVNHSSLAIFMTVVQNLCAGTAMPVAGICMALSAVNALAPGIGIGGLSSFFKKTYTSALALTMTIFTTVMGAQSLLASKADSLAGKAVKFAVGNMVPLVGSAIAGTLGTVSSGVEYIRSGVGVIGVVVIILLLMPTLLTLLVTKYAFSLASAAADILGCGAEGRMISELSGINGFLMASACICAVTLIFIVTIFAKCATATAAL